MAALMDDTKLDQPQDEPQPLNAKPKVPALGGALGAAPAPPPMTPGATVGGAPPMVPPPATSDPMAFSPATIGNAPPNVNPIPSNQPQIAPAMGANVDPQMHTPALGAAPGGQQDFSNPSLADAVQARYKAQQQQANQTGITAQPLDYSRAGMEESGAWMPSEQEKASEAARIQQIINDPTTTPGIKAAFQAGAGTPQFDRALNTPGTPESQYMDVLSKPTHEYVSPTAPPPGGAAQALAGAQRSAPTGPAMDSGGGMLTEGPMLAGIAQGGPSGSGAPSAPADPYRGGIQSTDPSNSLLGKTLLAGPATDRNAIARDDLSNWDAASEPYFQANLRSANQIAAGKGQGGSGQLRSRLGDVTQQHDLERTTAGKSFLSDALKGSIDDSYKNIGIAQQQQGFQQGQQESAFNQQAIQTQIEEAMRNGDFSRAMQLMQAGNQGNPSDTALAVSGIKAGQANSANSALGNMIGGNVANNAQKSNSGFEAWLQEYLKSIGGGASSSNQNPGADDGQ